MNDAVLEVLRLACLGNLETGSIAQWHLAQCLTVGQGRARQQPSGPFNNAALRHRGHPLSSDDLTVNNSTMAADRTLEAKKKKRATACDGRSGP
jgi:hypothetical protein